MLDNNKNNELSHLKKTDYATYFDSIMSEQSYGQPSEARIVSLYNQHWGLAKNSIVTDYTKTVDGVVLIKPKINSLKSKSLNTPLLYMNHFYDIEMSLNNANKWEDRLNFAKDFLEIFWFDDTCRHDYINIQCAIGESLDKLGKYTECDAYYKRIFAEHNNSMYILANYILTLMCRDDQNRALELLEKYVDLSMEENMDNQMLFYRAEEMYADIGNTKLAEKYKAKAEKCVSAQSSSALYVNQDLNISSSHIGELSGLTRDEKEKIINKANIEGEKKLIRMACENPEKYVPATLEKPIYTAEAFKSYLQKKSNLNFEDGFDIEQYQEPKDLKQHLSLIDQETFKLIETLTKSNFEITFTEENLPINYVRISEYLKPLGEIFVYDNTIKAIIFKEYHDKLTNINWDLLLQERKSIQTIKNTCELIAFYCGLVPYEDAYSQFKHWYPEYKNKFSSDEFVYVVECLFHMPQNYVEYFIPSLIGYADGYLCAHELVESEGISKEVLDDDGEQIKDNSICSDENVFCKLDEAKRWISKCEFSVLPHTMKCSSAFEYCRTIPEIVDFVQYLENYIPDGFSDLLYTRNVTDDFIIKFRENMPQLDTLQAFIQDNNIDVSAMKINKFAAYFKDAIISVPVWRFRGRTISQAGNLDDIDNIACNLENIQNSYIAKIKKNHKNSFLNDKTLRKLMESEPDFQSKPKIGRNEPCPCGSGKKYKKCCGRPNLRNKF